MRGLLIAFFIVIFSFETALACFEDTSVRCSRTELDIKVRSVGTTGPLFGESLGYFEWLTGCAGAASRSARRRIYPTFTVTSSG